MKNYNHAVLRIETASKILAAILRDSTLVRQIYDKIKKEHPENGIEENIEIFEEHVCSKSVDLTDRLFKKVIGEDDETR